MGEPVTEIRSDINRPVPPGWQRLHSDEGTYYWHSATDTSQWEYPTGNPYHHHEQHNYSNVTLSDNKVLIEEDLYAEPPIEDVRTLQHVLETDRKTGMKSVYVNVDGGGLIRQPVPARLPRMSGRSSQSSGKTERGDVNKDNDIKVIDKMQACNTSMEVESVHIKPKASPHSKSIDYDIPRVVRSCSPPEVATSSHQALRRVKSTPLESNYDVPVVPPKQGVVQSETRDHVYRIPPTTKPRPQLPKPYRAKSGKSIDSIDDRQKRVPPKKPQRRTKSESKMSTSPDDLDPIYSQPPDSQMPATDERNYAEPHNSQVKSAAQKLYNKLEGGVRDDESAKEGKALYDQLLSTSSVQPLPMVNSKVAEYSHLESKEIRGLDEKEKLRRMKEERLKYHNYEELDQPLQATMEQLPPNQFVNTKPSKYKDFSDDEAVNSKKRQIQDVEIAAGTGDNLYEVLSDHERFTESANDDQDGDGERTSLKSMENYSVKHDKLEDVDELAWDDTPIEAAFRATQSPNPTSNSSPWNSTASSEQIDSVYAVVEQKKKKGGLKNEDGLPDGWEIVNDSERTYYWHVPTGATQWEKPTVETIQERDRTYTAEKPPPVPVKTDAANFLVGAVQSSATNVDADVGLTSRMKELKSADMRFSSLNIGGSSPNMRRRLNMTEESVDGIQTFTAVSVGWVQLEESQLLGGKGSSAVSDSIYYIVQGKAVDKDGNPVITGHMWEKEKALYLQLHGVMLKLIDTDDKKVLMTQSIAGIRLFGAGRDCGQHFAFVARDKVTRRHRCHVFQCDVPGNVVAMALERVCNKAMKEREERKRQEQLEEAGHVGRRLARLGDIGVSTEQEKKSFAATYLGKTDVPKGTGVEVVHNAIEKLRACNPRTWQEVIIEVMSSSVKLIDQKTQQVIQEHRVSLISFLSLAKDKHYCGYITSPSREIHWCHAFASEESSGGLTRAIKEACHTRYNSVVESRQGLQQPSVDKNPALPVSNFHKTSAISAGAGAAVSASLAPSSSDAADLSTDGTSGLQEGKTMRGTLRSLFTKLDPRRSTKKSQESLPSVSSYVHYMGSENMRSRDLDFKEGLDGAMRRLKNSRFVIACECAVSASHVTLIDSQRRSFSKRLFPLLSIMYSDRHEDVFGFITNKDKIHVCHVFTKMGKCDVDAVCQAIQSRIKQA